jgi:hypothetical protein
MPQAAFGSFTIASPLGTSTGFLAAINDNTLTALSKPKQLKQLALYPNPAHLGVTIAVPGIPAGDLVTLTITDATGRVALSQAIVLKDNTGRHDVNLSGLSTGLYLVRVWAAGKAATQILAVE